MSGISRIVTDLVLRSSSKIISLEAHAFPSDVITFSNQSRLLLKSTRPLDREKDGEILSVDIRLIMRDCSLSSRRKFVIRVTDVNDNIPQFHNVDFKSGYKTSIREDATTGSVVASVSVTDGDATSPNNIVKLKPLPPYDRVFGFKGSDLILTDARAVRYFHKSKYYVMIEAEDCGLPPLSNKIVIEVDISPVSQTELHIDNARSPCHLKAVVHNANKTRLSDFTSTNGYLEINNIISRNVAISKGLWILYSDNEFRGETKIVQNGGAREPNERIETAASLRGFCLHQPFLALFDQTSFTGKMTVFSTTKNKLFLKTKSALVMKTSWAISTFGFLRPHLLECTSGHYTKYPYLPIGQALVMAVKRLSSDGTVGFKNLYKD
ncbi:protocadherin beta-11-like isoform X2 [Corticium candelabrum]|nr:protocadherin beta-11-like isoform X2 [Corticium candelabrum]XP_062519386.1 protocadherin beta-11-like isoform X2 [Corticium candelabrum]